MPSDILSYQFQIVVVDVVDVVDAEKCNGCGKRIYTWHIIIVHLEIRVLETVARNNTHT